MTVSLIFGITLAWLNLDAENFFGVSPSIGSTMMAVLKTQSKIYDK